MKALILAALIVIAVPAVAKAEPMSSTETCRDQSQVQAASTPPAPLPQPTLSDTYSQGESALVCTVKEVIGVEFCLKDIGDPQPCVGCPPEGQKTDDPVGSADGGKSVYVAYFPANPFQGGGYHSIVVSLDPGGC